MYDVLSSLTILWYILNMFRKVISNEHNYICNTIRDNFLQAYLALYGFL